MTWDIHYLIIMLLESMLVIILSIRTKNVKSIIINNKFRIEKYFGVV